MQVVITCAGTKMKNEGVGLYKGLGLRSRVWGSGLVQIRAKGFGQEFRVHIAACQHWSSLGIH